MNGANDQKKNGLGNIEVKAISSTECVRFNQNRPPNVYQVYANKCALSVEHLIAPLH